MANNKSIKFFHFIGILLFIYLLYKIDLGKALADIKEFNFFWLIIYFSAFTVMVLLKAYRWKLLLLAQDISYSFRKALLISITSNFLGALTPGRLGELIKLDYLKKDNYSIQKGIVNVFIDRSFDLFMLALFSLLSMMYFIDLFYNELTEIFIGVIVLLIAALFIYYSRKGIKKFASMILRKILPSSKYSLIENHRIEFIEEIRAIRLLTLFKMFAVSVVIYLLTFLMTFLVSLGFGIKISFVYLSFCMSLASLVSLLPVSIGGIGTREAVFIVLLGNNAVPKESALLIAFFDSTILGNLFTALFALLKYVYLKYNTTAELT